jgi:FKBP-type peptidyl-prolyl cis-trans isomerase 2
MSKVKSGDKIRVHYKGTLTESGDMFDSSEGREPLEFTVGAGHVIPGFDNGVMEMEVGEKKTINIPMDQAYGPKHEQNVIDVDRAQLPPEMKDLEAGMMLQMVTPEGQPIPVTIVSFTDEKVKLDANHALAGKDLTFDLELVSINEEA